MTDLRRGVLSPEPSQQCDSCGEWRELRPYGPPGKTMICFECGTATPEMEATCRENFLRMLREGELPPYPEVTR